jgi:hypothetical protein
MTQAVSITTGNPSMSKIFTKTAENGKWDGNVLTDSISGQSIGILIPNAPLTFAQANYTAGVMAFRLQDAQTLRVKSRGLGNLTGLDCIESQSITPVTVGQNDILTVYPLPVASATRTNNLAWIQTSKSTELFTATDVVDDIPQNLISAVNNQTVGDLFFGSTLQRIWVSTEDGGKLNSLEVINEAGAVVMTVQGGPRGASGGSKSNQYNMYAVNLGIPIGKGWNIRITTTSA